LVHSDASYNRVGPSTLYRVGTTNTHAVVWILHTLRSLHKCRTISVLVSTLLSNNNALVGRNESRVPHSWPSSCVARLARWHDIAYIGQKRAL
jgi:hypothetical protein